MTANNPVDKRRSFASFVVAVPSIGGVAGGMVFFWFSLTPTLLPRAWFMQAGISALSTAIGYGIGALAGFSIRWLWTRSGREPIREITRRRIWIGLGVIGTLAVVVGLILWQVRQTEQRDLVQMAHLSPVFAAAMLALAALLAAVFILIGRMLAWVVYRFDRLLSRWVPRWAAHGITVLAIVVLVVVLVQDVVISGFVGWANNRYGADDVTGPPGVTQPESPTVSGSPASLVAWDTLGYQGRVAVTGAATVEELEAFHGDAAEVMEPIRAYVGLGSADTPDERAQLAVDELERMGAFERSVLMVVTATGTGWIDPDAAHVLEYMHAGDTAIVGMEYSFLPSWISFLTDKEKAATTGAALHDAVFERWSQLPADERPDLLVFGESLGTFGSESAFVGDDAADSVANLTSKSDAVLWVGPTNSNPILRQLEENRERGTPVWRPTYQHGDTVRWVNRSGEAKADEPTWVAPRVLYYHHPSDPVGYWNWETLWRPQEWSADPVGYDVSPHVGWFPVVAWIQVLADLMAGFGTGPGFGHNYSSDFVDAFTVVLPVDGWTDADATRLAETLGLDAGAVTSSD